MKKKKIVAAAFIVLLLGVGIYVYYGQWKAKNREIYYSGTIEAVRAEIGFQASGRVVKVHVKEGQHVEKGKLLAELDTSEFEARYGQARANLERARRTVLHQRTLLEVYRKTLPADVERAQAALAAAKVVLEDAERNMKRYDQLFRNEVISERERDSVRLHYDTAKARYDEARAGLDQAKSNLRRIDATAKEIEAAEAQVKSSESSLEQSEIQLGYAELNAPFSGIITSRNVEPGEVITPNRKVLSLADLSSVDLKIFVDETEIGKVKPGRRVEVRVDTFPGKIYEGSVAYISPEAEFTPKVIQTHKERVKLVYLVKITVPNPNLELKSGMPADAWLR
ncbi:MAG: efflux RND transporter periplasmic adaptor subunit [Syntrophales bacterium]|nr:efflux RND transporter periplasmic adaptor subunit [Syntrophales bacterium]MDD5233976.1 efflux RND transporter periplasmic adaptor subunit [Syntrophales bacterium]MDD5533334.1 efflux RND transporter periplasmic adaptor subunit [Syntrophales bacterium]